MECTFLDIFLLNLFYFSLVFNLIACNAGSIRCSTVRGLFFVYLSFEICMSWSWMEKCLVHFIIFVSYCTRTDRGCWSARGRSALVCEHFCSWSSCCSYCWQSLISFWFSFHFAFDNFCTDGVFGHLFIIFVRVLPVLGLGFAGCWPGGVTIDFLVIFSLVIITNLS